MPLFALRPMLTFAYPCSPSDHVQHTPKVLWHSPQCDECHCHVGGGVRRSTGELRYAKASDAHIVGDERFVRQLSLPRVQHATTGRDGGARMNASQSSYRGILVCRPWLFDSPGAPRDRHGEPMFSHAGRGGTPANLGNAAAAPGGSGVSWGWGGAGGGKPPGQPVYAGCRGQPCRCFWR